MVVYSDEKNSLQTSEYWSKNSQIFERDDGYRLLRSRHNMLDNIVLNAVSTLC